MERCLNENDIAQSAEWLEGKCHQMDEMKC